MLDYRRNVAKFSIEVRDQLDKLIQDEVNNILIDTADDPIRLLFEITDDAFGDVQIASNGVIDFTKRAVAITDYKMMPSMLSLEDMTDIVGATMRDVTRATQLFKEVVIHDATWTLFYYRGEYTAIIYESAILTSMSDINNDIPQAMRTINSMVDDPTTMISNTVTICKEEIK